MIPSISWLREDEFDVPWSEASRCCETTNKASTTLIVMLCISYQLCVADKDERGAVVTTPSVVSRRSALPSLGDMTLFGPVKNILLYLR